MSVTDSYQERNFILDSEALNRADSCRKLSKSFNSLKLRVPYFAKLSSISFIKVLEFRCKCKSQQEHRIESIGTLVNLSLWHKVKVHAIAG